MQIQPSITDFEKWIGCVPVDGDLVFVSRDKASLLENLPVERLARDQVKEQGLSIWTLNKRSWYGYALDSADYCSLLPIGALEGLDQKLQQELADEQRRLHVPTVTADYWLTSYAWSSISTEEKIKKLQQWFDQNQIGLYQSFDFFELPETARSELVRTGCDMLLNSFADKSGPNCFATTAGAFCNDPNLFQQWMHWPEFERYLDLHGFASVDGPPQPGDVLSFKKSGTWIHASYFLGDGFYFEKPGQDFYEPYRLARLQDWQTEWPESQLSMLRRKP